jgi:hypothetical protein
MEKPLFDSCQRARGESALLIVPSYEALFASRSKVIGRLSFGNHSRNS